MRRFRSGLPPSRKYDIFPRPLRQNRFSSPFVFPDQNKKRRLREKTSTPAFGFPCASASDQQVAEAPQVPLMDPNEEAASSSASAQQVAEAPQEPLMDPDEEAARAMHS